MGFSSFSSCDLPWCSHDNTLSVFLSLPFPLTFAHTSLPDPCTGAALLELHAPQHLDGQKTAERQHTDHSRLCVPVPCDRQSDWELGHRGPSPFSGSS